MRSAGQQANGIPVAAKTEGKDRVGQIRERADSHPANPG